MQLSVFGYKVTIERIVNHEYYIIMGSHSRVPMGLTTDKADVLAEESGADFVPITKTKYEYLQSIVAADDEKFEQEAARLVGELC